ncbi:MAG: glycerate kinase [Bacilli bacterium]
MNKRRILINRITKVGIFAAISIVLYHFSFPLPFFPSFLKVNFSMMVIIIAGLMFGPIDAFVIVVLRCLIGMITSSTGFVGEIADLIIGTLTIVPTATIYHFNRNKKGGYIAVGVAFLMWVLSGTLSNLFTMPIYVRVLGLDKILPVIAKVIPSVNESNYLSKYLLFGALPFNVVVASAVCLATLFLYKHISNIFKHDFFGKIKQKEEHKGKIMTLIDSFKGTMTSKEANEIVKQVLTSKGYLVDTLPISDGGDGFLDTIYAITKISFFSCQVNDALFRVHNARYLYDEKNQTAYLEMAECCGIQNLKKEELNAFEASSYGLGEQIKYVVETHHPQKIVIGIGGSASSDAGSGMLEAMGASFYNKNDELLSRLNNQKLSEVDKIRVGSVKTLLSNIQIEVLTDVTNPLLGEKGAIYVFAKQKGAKEEDLAILESNISHFSKIVEEQLFGSNSIDQKGEGAAGGVGFAFNRIIKAKIINGSEKILSLINFAKMCEEYDIIITGEGKFDQQTLDGKIIKGIMEYHPKKLIIVTGIAEIETDQASVYPIVPTICDLETSLSDAKGAFTKLIDSLPL